FYETLGIDLLQEQHGRGAIHYSGKVGHILLEVYPLPKDASNTDATTRLGFAVEKLTETVEALRAVGATVVSEPQATEWGHRAIVHDPDGRAVEIYQRKLT